MLAPISSSAFFRDRGVMHFAEDAGAAPDGLRLVRIMREDGRSFESRIGRDAIVQIAAGKSAREAFLRFGLEAEPLFEDGPRLWRVEAGGLDGAGLDGVGLASRLAADDAREWFSMAVPNYRLAHRSAAIDVPPDDPRYGGQWYFERLGVEEAWSYSTGTSSVSIVVVDNGCDLTHPDLVAKLDPGRDEIDDDDDPTFVPARAGNEHGTACAGLIAASTNNAIGIAGACPECRMRCVRLTDAVVPLAADVRAFAFAKNMGASVVSNSWGFGESIPVPGPLETAILDVIDNGRSGRGAIVVFAAGNQNREIQDDELEAVRGVIAVGALTIFDEATSFSNRGRALDVVSPIGSLSTDIAGAEGQDPTDYTNNFGGTSSACPLVSGVAALLVSAKPEATGTEIADAIITTTRVAPFAVPDVNGHDLTYGYGIVSAPRAMRKLLGIEEPPPDAGVVPDSGAAPDAESPTDAGTPGDSGEVSGSGDSGCSATGVPAKGGSTLALWIATLAIVFLARRRI